MSPDPPLLVGTAKAVRRRDVDVVEEAGDVAHHVVVVLQLLELAGTGAFAHQGAQAAARRVVAVVALDAVAEQVGELLMSVQLVTWQRDSKFKT